MVRTSATTRLQSQYTQHIFRTCVPVFFYAHISHGIASFVLRFFSEETDHLVLFLNVTQLHRLRDLEMLVCLSPLHAIPFVLLSEISQRPSRSNAL